MLKPLSFEEWRALRVFVADLRPFTDHDDLAMVEEGPIAGWLFMRQVIKRDIESGGEPIDASWDQLGQITRLDDGRASATVYNQSTIGDLEEVTRWVWDNYAYNEFGLVTYDQITMATKLGEERAQYVILAKSFASEDTLPRFHEKVESLRSAMGREPDSYLTSGSFTHARWNPSTPLEAAVSIFVEWDITEDVNGHASP